MTTPLSALAAASPAHASTGTLLTTVAPLVQQARQTDNLHTKRELLTAAYQAFRTEALSRGSQLPTELAIPFYDLLHTYAKETCYAQEGADGDEEEGFRKSARLMELSFLLQLTALDLGRTEYPWTTYDTPERLIQSLEVQKSQEGKFFRAVTEMPLDADILFAKAKDAGIQEVVASTLTRLTYSYQNLDALQIYALQKRFSDLTEKLIGNDAEALVDFLYNRCRFLISLQEPRNVQRQIESYEPVRQKVLELWPEGALKRESLLAQIANMQGILTTQPKTPEAYARAEPFFQTAFERRLPLVTQGASDAECWEQRYLLCNIRTALIKCSLMQTPLTEANIQKAKEHADELKTFLADAEVRGNAHCYISGYRPLILMAEAAKAK